MPRRLAVRPSWWLAGACGAWMVAFLAPLGPGALLAVPIAVVGVSMSNRSPVWAAALVLVANVVAAHAGAAWGGVDTVAAIAAVMFALGRHVPPASIGVVAAAAFALTSVARAPFALTSAAVALAVFGAPWAYGRAVRHRDLAAEAAARAAEAVARIDPDRLSARLVAEERRQLAESALDSLRTAVGEMAMVAEDALCDLDPGRIDSVRTIGADAVVELRRLLGLLRAPQQAEVTSPVPSDGGGGRRPRAVDAAAAVGLGGAAAVAVAVAGEGTATLLVVGLHLTVVIAVAVRRAFPALASLASAVPTLLIALEPPPEPTVLLPAAAGYALLTWTSIGGGERGSLLAVGGLFATAVAAAVPFGPEALGFMALSFGGPALARSAWRDRDDLFRSAEERRRGLQARLDRMAADAVRSERLRLARDLHDLTGHAVGVMVMQAGAARALLPAAPQRAREALRAAVQAGADATREIDEMVSTLDLGPGIDVPTSGGGASGGGASGGGASGGGASGGGASGSGPAPPPRTLDELIARMADAGMVLKARLGAVPEDRNLFEAVFRVVQEGLTNASRHAPGSRVEVEVDRSASGYFVRVADRAVERRVPGTGPSSSTGGFGLIGLAERIRTLGGSLHAGPHGPDGFELTAHLPSPYVVDEPGRADTARAP